MSGTADSAGAGLVGPPAWPPPPSGEATSFVGGGDAAMPPPPPLTAEEAALLPPPPLPPPAAAAGSGVPASSSDSMMSDAMAIGGRGMASALASALSSGGIEVAMPDPTALALLDRGRGLERGSGGVSMGGGVALAAGPAAAAAAASLAAEAVTMKDVIAVIKGQPADLDITMQRDRKTISDLKRRIVLEVRNNYILEKELSELDHKIKLLIRNRAKLTDVLLYSDGLTGGTTESHGLMEASTRVQYGHLFYLLQNHTEYLARVVRLVEKRGIDTFLRTVVLTLYGDQYETREERLLLSLFHSVLQEEFASAGGDMGSFMRANTCITQMLSTYARRPGSLATMKDILAPLIEEMLAKGVVLEINPVKVYDTVVSDWEIREGKPWEGPRSLEEADAKQHPQVQAILAARTEQLTNFCELLFARLIETRDALPFGVRWLCKQLDTMGRATFEGATQDQLNGLIGGFFFLRFVNPIIVMPDANNFVKKKPSREGRRNLTLVAKVMQNLSNGIMFSGKEAYMSPLNGFITTNAARCNDFFRALVDVEELEGRLAVDKYLEHVQTRERSIILSYNEVIAMHALLEHHLDVVAPEAEDELRAILGELGAAPEKVGRKEDVNFTLTLQDRNKERKAKMMEEEKEEESLAEVVRASLSSVLRRLQLPAELADDASASLPAVLAAGKAAAIASEDYLLAKQVKLLEAQLTELAASVGVDTRNAAALSAWRSDFVAQFYQEACTFSDVMATMEEQIAQLNRAMDNIREHHSFLQEKLDYYKRYLQSARENVAAGDGKKGKKKKKKKKKGSSRLKFSHGELESQGIITSSTIDPRLRKNIMFTFAPAGPGVFEVSAGLRGFTAVKTTLLLEDLLEKKQRHTTTIEMNQVSLNVNLLIHLFNTRLIS